MIELVRRYLEKCFLDDTSSNMQTLLGCSKRSQTPFALASFFQNKSRPVYQKEV